MIAAIGQLFFGAGVNGHVGHGVMTVQAIHAFRVEAALGEVGAQLGGEQNVDIGGQNELATGAADADILANHLIQGQRGAVWIAGVQLRGYFDDANRARTRLRAATGAPGQGAGDRAADSIRR